MTNLFSALKREPRSRKQMMELTGMGWFETQELLRRLREELDVDIRFEKTIGRYELISQGKLKHIGAKKPARR